MKKPLHQWLAICLLFASASSLAHKQSDSYLTISVEGSSLHGQWDIAVRDLDLAIGLDTNDDEQITWGEVRSQADRIHGHAFARLAVSTRDGARTSPCGLRAERTLVDDHVDGTYVALFFTGECAATATHLGLDYSLLAGEDPNHRGLLDLRANGQALSLVMSNAASTRWVNVDSPDRWHQFRSYVGEGVRHIWLGYDHLLFLFTLLLPSVVVRRDGQWQARSSLREGSIDIVKVVTAFTLAHSLTLSLAALSVIELPSRLVESAIALTVLLGALNIVFPIVRERRWLLALGFGLIHGLGFASVLGDLGLEPDRLLETLIAFNLGVEAGQLVVVALLMPAAFLVRATTFYRRVLLPAGASAIGMLAIYWLLTRSLSTG